MTRRVSSQRTRPCHNRIVLRIAVVLLVGAAAAVTGCTKTHAKTVPVPPPLMTPTPPDRQILAAPQPVAVELPSQEPVAPPAVPSQPEKSSARPSGTPLPAPPPAAAPPEPVASPSPVLQTTPNPPEVEKQANALLAAARRDLHELERARLSANAQAQYDSALGFINQAEQALRIQNVVLARDLADKAASLASQLKR
jgi:type IV secretory pathway VirB10-like protein